MWCRSDQGGSTKSGDGGFRFRTYIDKANSLGTEGGAREREELRWAGQRKSQVAWSVGKEIPEWDWLGRIGGPFRGLLSLQCPLDPQEEAVQGEHEAHRSRIQTWGLATRTHLESPAYKCQCKPSVRAGSSGSKSGFRRENDQAEPWALWP